MKVKYPTKCAHIDGEMIAAQQAAAMTSILGSIGLVVMANGAVDDQMVVCNRRV
jgi:hypothetical protein